MAIARWTPFLELEAFDRRLRRMLDLAGLDPSVLPHADVYETDDEYVVELEVPGYEENELDVEVFDRVLCIKGTRSETTDLKEKRFQRRERLDASFERRFALPSDVGSESVRASFAKGVLEIHAARAKEAAPKKVAIGTT